MVRGRRAFGLEGVSLGLGPQGGRLLKAASVGIEFSLSTVIGALGGRWLDGKLGTDPWLMLVGLVLGVAAGFRSLIRTAQRANRENETHTDSNEPPPQ
jgi:ATP synthase protein I